MVAKTIKWRSAFDCTMRELFDVDLAILMSKLSIRSYRSPEKFNEAELGLKVEEFLDFEKTHTQLYLLTDENRLFIAFRGSESLKDVVNDLMFIKKKYPPVSRFFFKPRVHNGFLYSFNHIKKELFELIEKLQATKKRQIYVTGHSLGAALATLTSFELKSELGVESIMYNFGCPRVGNRWFVRMYNQLDLHTFRIVNDDDFVTSLPKFGYKHVKTLVYIYNSGEIHIQPSKIRRIFERLDNLIAFFSGDAVIDHLEHNYLEALEKIKEVQSASVS